jgi:predicted outer membrane repeat protein
LSFATLRYCIARQPNGASTTAKARGGGVFAKGNVRMYSSVVSGNLADAAQDANSAGAFGGGIYALGDLYLFSSTLDSNTAAGNGTVSGNSFGGGARVATRMSLSYSTVSNNHADFDGGLLSPSVTYAHSVSNSTISGNTANFGVGGIDVSAGILVQNSTIAFNRGVFGAGGLAVGSSAGYLKLYSTIIANDTGSADLDFEPDAAKLTGSGNLVMSSTVASPVTGLNADPRLAPLANHGGPTRTHALLPGSPAFATGVNPGNLLYDQRGPGFSRTGFVLSFVYTDIGAYQVQMFNDDELFYDGFRPGGG